MWELRHLILRGRPCPAVGRTYVYIYTAWNDTLLQSLGAICNNTVNDLPHGLNKPFVIINHASSLMAEYYLQRKTL